MLFLLIKKSFFDAWDNLGIVIILNFIMTVITISGIWLLLNIAQDSFIFFLLILLGFFQIFCLIYGVLSGLTQRIVDYKSSVLTYSASIFRCSWKASMIYALMVIFLFVSFLIGFFYYIDIGGFAGLLAASVLFWMTVTIYFAGIWFFPVRNRLSGNIFKSIKKCFLIMFDNVFITLFMGLFVIPVNLILWPISAFIAFGPVGISICSESALKLMMFKYDWQEKQAPKERQRVPWHEILADERERIGQRSLKGMIFPWKD